MTDTMLLRADETDGAIPFAQSFVASEAFRELFREGMTLVEQTAHYLDGDGRAESPGLGREGALAYATESMRLTTRLMQIASWLLVQRAVAEGEISPAQARTEKNRVKIGDSLPLATAEEFAALPERLRALIGHSLRLQGRLLHLEGLMCGARPVVAAANPVRDQIETLRAMLGAPA